MKPLCASLLTTLLALAGCSSSDSPATTPDAAGGAGGQADAGTSCGKPGDPGNALGVGKYCQALSDCKGNGKATLCATLGGDPTQTFCTMMCVVATDGGADPCAAGATCSCQGGQCGCTPDVCL